MKWSLLQDLTYVIPQMEPEQKEAFTSSKINLVERTHFKVVPLRQGKWLINTKHFRHNTAKCNKQPKLVFLKKQGVHMLKGKTRKEKKTQQQTSTHGCSTGTMRGWVGWHSTVSCKETAIGRVKKGFNDSDNNNFEIFTWNGIKERWRKVQETKVNHRTKTTSCEGEARHRACDTKAAQMQLVKTILQPHKIVSSTTKHLEPTVLKQTRKQQQKTFWEVLPQ